jgi:hypothetical protein
MLTRHWAVIGFLYRACSHSEIYRAAHPCPVLLFTAGKRPMERTQAIESADYVLPIGLEGWMEAPRL